MGDVLIIGGTGFCGPHLAKELTEQGRSVRVASRRGQDAINAWNSELLTDADVTSADMTDISSLNRAMEGVDTVILAAGVTKSRDSDNRIEDDINRNLRGTLNVMNASAAHGVKHVVYFSSGGAIYGSSEVPFRETDSCAPLSSYGVVKLASEGYIRLLGQRHGIKTTFCRLSNPVGPGQTGLDGQGIVAVFFRALSEGRVVSVLGDGSATRDYVHVVDAMRAVSYLLQNEHEGIYNIGSGQSHSIMDVVHCLEHVTGKRIETSFQDAKHADLGHVGLSVTKLLSETDWRPTRDLTQSIVDFVSWAERHKALLKAA